jgi:hypothetical protein
MHGKNLWANCTADIRGGRTERREQGIRKSGNQVIRNQGAGFPLVERMEGDRRVFVFENERRNEY